ncbi:PWWP domain [Dillenia turbinata]|uniref:PWWP domain n=1 Tax=Dillenia turbinata TaxID=194707 RepID=A0AAN8UPK9_9MAGN
MIALAMNEKDRDLDTNTGKLPNELDQKLDLQSRVSDRIEIDSPDSSNVRKSEETTFSLELSSKNLEDEVVARVLDGNEGGKVEEVKSGNMGEFRVSKVRRDLGSVDGNRVLDSYDAKTESGGSEEIRVSPGHEKSEEVGLCCENRSGDFDEQGSHRVFDTDDDDRVSLDHDLGCLKDDGDTRAAEIIDRINLEAACGGLAENKVCTGHGILESNGGVNEAPNRGKSKDINVSLKMESTGDHWNKEDLTSSKREVAHSVLGLSSMHSPVDMRAEAHGHAGSQYDSLISAFDDYAAGEMADTKALRYGFELGDLVWGKVKSHPWWPGHIFNEALASPSVRRTRREGHVLVAFFGDSSYGWFHPAELIPFEPNHTEKSQQTNSRNFVKAVEEAVDETSRRCALGLVCYCRNPNNFKPTKVKGYFVVDVPDYEPGGVYSINQIKKSRDGFRASDILSFTKKLAVMPKGGDPSNIERIKNRATVLAYRKAVFEEYDETYAQAFGMQLVCPSRESAVGMPARDMDKYALPSSAGHVDCLLVSIGVHTVYICDVEGSNYFVLSSAPLSGPLVMAEALGGRKGSIKPMKSKEPSGKDKYLFKRREEASNSRSLQNSEGRSSPLSASTYVERPFARAGDYIFQRRDPESFSQQILEEHETTTAALCKDIASFHQEATGSGESMAKSTVTSPRVQTPVHHNVPMGKDDVEDAKPTLVMDTSILGGPDFSGKGAISADVVMDFRQENDASANVSFVNSEEQGLSSSPIVQESQDQNNLADSRPLVVDAKLGHRKLGTGTGSGVKKAKPLKRKEDGQGYEKSVVGDKKKKRKVLAGETQSDFPRKLLATGDGGKLSQVGRALSDNSLADHQKRNDVASDSFSGSSGSLTAIAIGDIKLGLPELLSDLEALSLDPFHGAQRNSPAIILQVFQRFRNLVFQKSLVLSPPAETEPSEACPSKSLTGVAAPESPVKVAVSLKSSKPPLRSDDPTKSGGKRAPSDRQEEIAAKRTKKMADLRSLAAERKANLKSQEAPRTDAKGGPSGQKVFKPDSFKKLEPSNRKAEPSVKRPEPSPREAEPITLAMKFPAGTSLPSGAELRAKFARFGPLDHSATRIFWKTSTCRLVFLHKVNGQKAYKYAYSNNLFGNGVKYSLKEVGVLAAEAPDPSMVETLQMQESALDQRLDTPAFGRQPPQSPAVQLKSCLKKSSGDEAGPAMGGVIRGTPRVKFMLGGEENRTEQMMVGNRNNFNNIASFGDDGASSTTTHAMDFNSKNGGASSTTTTLAMDFNCKNFQKVIPPHSQPLLPLPPQFAKIHLQSQPQAQTQTQNMHFPDASLRNLKNFSVPDPPPLQNIGVLNPLAQNFGVRNPPPLQNFSAQNFGVANSPPLQNFSVPNPPPPVPPQVDISVPMLALLHKFHEVVSKVRDIYGYMPYHPL